MGNDGAGTSESSGVKEGSLTWMILTRMNYAEWVMLMEINYEAMEIWDVLDPGINVKRSRDR